MVHQHSQTADAYEPNTGGFPKCFTEFSEFSDKKYLTVKGLEIATQPSLALETRMLPKRQQDTSETGSLNDSNSCFGDLSDSLNSVKVLVHLGKLQCTQTQAETKDCKQCSMKNFLWADQINDRFNVAAWDIRQVSVFDVRNERVTSRLTFRTARRTAHYHTPSRVNRRKSAQPRGHGIPCLWTSHMYAQCSPTVSTSDMLHIKYNPWWGDWVLLFPRFSVHLPPLNWTEQLNFKVCFFQSCASINLDHHQGVCT